VDIRKLNKSLINKIKQSKKTLVIDGHLSHYLPSKYVKFCIVVRCDIKILHSRLRKRKYNKNKIQENLQAEIFDIPLTEAVRNKHKIRIIDTTKGFKI